jgi:NADH dehydrogenase FAD-containing subunit
MAWYTAMSGSWEKPETVQHIAGTYNRKEIFEKAQNLANEKNVVVTVMAETSSVDGLHAKFYEVIPERH